MIQPCRYVFHLEVIIFKEFHFLRQKLGLFVSMTQCSNFLAVHPVEESLLATISPCPDTPILSESHRMIISKRNINNPEAQSFKLCNLYWTIKSDILLIALTQDAPISRSKHVKSTIFGYSGRMTRAQPQRLHIKIIKRSNPLWFSFGYCNLLFQIRRFGTKRWLRRPEIDTIAKVPPLLGSQHSFISASGSLQCQLKSLHAR